MDYKNQREQQVSYLLKQLDCELIEHIWKFNEETTSYKCNKCGKEHKFNFSHLYNKIKYKQVCTCHESNKIEMLEMYSLEKFNQELKESQEELIKNNNDRKEFLKQEISQVMYVISKNRSCKSYKVIDGKINLICNENHSSIIKYEDVIKGKWCNICEESENYYFTKKE